MLDETQDAESDRESAGDGDSPATGATDSTTPTPANSTATTKSASEDFDEAALSVQGLSKTFGSGEDAVTAVDDISFSVAPGEVIGLLGPNGAGKTTTIKSILGLILPDEGEVNVRGIDVYDRPRQAYEHVDAMLEGARNDYWRLTVRENLRYFAAVRGQDPDALADRHDELLDALDLAEKADTAVRDLSRGMKQKVSLASVLAGSVSVAFLDEPTLGLDVESSLTLRRELVRLAEERGLTLVISSHDMEVVEDVCDRVVIMSEGRIVADDTVENLLAGFETQGYRITARNLDEAALADLHERFDLSAVDRTGGRTRFEVAADTAAFYRLTDALERHGVELDGVDTVQPDLAEAFVEMTAAGGGRVAEAGPELQGGESR
ncbi:ABC transporter ATP-binding protein [Halorussus litoreus]|uniref:ABC transporter ATP-binding protein n=1 Tax=Halorussus litoreus TaxID=1710536 RepID=UPI000E264911|nr:ABC transporter ATP-binding protein [Halorussus litoreus]